MEEEEQPTQVATQQFLDPRRIGLGNSGLDDDDLEDIYCILHPASPPAFRAMAFIHESTPEHTISTNRGGQRSRPEGPHLQHEDDTDDDAFGGAVACDIALRLSAETKSDGGGFSFGRNQARCDIILGRDDTVKRISNIHFRIYITEYGVIMLEDQSTNGTIVDGILLRAKEKENGNVYQHSLEKGAIITLAMTPPDEDVRFFVRIPQRDDLAENAYQRNLTNYCNRVNRAQKEKQLRIRRGIKKGIRPVAESEPTERGNPPNIFATPDVEIQRFPTQTRSGRHVREWKGGSKYNKVQTIGKGAFAVVYMITAKYDGTPYAAKELEKRRFMKNGILDQKVDQEMRIMQRISHPNIVQFIEHIDWDEHLYIIMEFVPDGDLGSLVGEGGPVKEMESQVMARQLLSALDYLHRMNITHRDVKPDNILIQSISPIQVKLTDFGLSKMVDTEETFLRTFCGTLLYCAPEVYTEYREYDNAGVRAYRGHDRKTLPPQRYDHAVDIWSLAGVLFYTLCGSPPYPAQNGTTYLDLLNQIMTRALDIRPLQRYGVSDPAIRFIKSMLQPRPEYRATIAELELSSWFMGIDSQPDSYDEEDEVDLVGAGYAEIEEGASQLSINRELTEIRQPKIPESFETSKEGSIGDESYGYVSNGATNPTNGRLFGEVGVSAVGSSGAIPYQHLPTPIARHFSNPKQSLLEGIDPELESERLNLAGSWAVLPPPQLPSAETTHSDESDRRGARSSSLMGAESMVGHLNMKSPSAASSPGGEALLDDPDLGAGVSLRRRREDSDEFLGGDRSLHPSDFQASKRRKSTREIDLPVPPSVFWDPKDKSTHHSDYPTMSYSNYRTYQEQASQRGEKFSRGGAVFESTMQSFRSSLGESESGELSKKTNSQRDVAMPPTARGSREPEAQTHNPGTNIMPQPVVGNDFQPPKRILAKLFSTADSCLPTIHLNIIEPLTSWGRGFQNTIRYSDGRDVRVPKYAFKIFLFKPGFYGSNIATPGNGKNSSDDDMTFYISTKASAGIYINGTKLPSFEANDPCSPSRYWMALRHGDIIAGGLPASQFTRFRFECYWGSSKHTRPKGERMTLLSQGSLLDELEEACLAQQTIKLEEIKRRNEEDTLAAKQAEEQKSRTAAQHAISV